MKNVKTLFTALVLAPSLLFAGNYLNLNGSAAANSVLVASDSSNDGIVVSTPIQINPSTGNMSGVGSFTPASIAVSNAASGANSIISVTNTSNTANSNAVFSATVGGASSGDPLMLFIVPSGQTWALGEDNSASDNFVLAASGALGTGNVLSITTGGSATLQGSLTLTAGNLVYTSAGSGAIYNVVTASGAASGPVTCNGRICSVTFTGVSIAAGATLALTVADSSVAGSGTVVMYSMSGDTAGAALSAVSAASTSGHWALTLTNGTGATTTTANVVVNLQVMN